MMAPTQPRPSPRALFHDYTPEQVEAEARTARTARPYLLKAARRLRARPGVGRPDPAAARAPAVPASDRWRDKGLDNRVTVEHAPPDNLQAHCNGDPDDDGFVVNMSLLPDWTDRIEAAGLALVDGWFVADAHDYAGGRPRAVTVLDLIPFRGDTTRLDDGQYAHDHSYRLRRMPIRWDGGTPRIDRAPEEPSQPSKS